MNKVDPIKPPIGSKVAVGFLSHNYTAEVVSHGRKYCQVRFTLKSGRVVTRMVAVFPKGTPGCNQPEGYLFAIYNPNSFGNTSPAEPAVHAKLRQAKGEFDTALKAFQEARRALSVAEAAFENARIAVAKHEQQKKK